MSELLQASLQFPTVVFSVALGIVLVYWMFVVVGALDHDAFGGDHDAGHDGGHDVDADGGIWAGLGLAAVPITISVSFIVLVAWITSLLVMHYVVGPAPAAWLRAALFPAFVLGALPVSALLVRPLAPVFRFREGKSNAEYVGHACTVTTGHVDDRFGQATIEDGGTVLVVQVRCDQPGKLVRGDKALVVDFDLERQAYLVEKE